MAEITVRLLAGDDGEESRKMLRDFSSDIARLEGVKPSTNAATRGDPVTLGMIVLAAVKSGALTALINTIANYVNRDRRNEIEFSSANGETIRVSSPCNLIELEETVRRLLPASDDRFTRITTEDWPRRKVAILVANDEFPEDDSIPPLHFTQNDAEALKVVLEDEACGFRAHTFVNQSSYKIKADLNRICRQLTEHDTILFYYAGHGKLDGNELCFATIDTTSESLEATSLRAEDVLRYLRKTLSKRRVVILDCCHSGVIADRFRGNDLVDWH